MFFPPVVLEVEAADVAKLEGLSWDRGEGIGLDIEEVRARGRRESILEFSLPQQLRLLLLELALLLLLEQRSSLLLELRSWGHRFQSRMFSGSKRIWGGVEDWESQSPDILFLLDASLPPAPPPPPAAAPAPPTPRDPDIVLCCFLLLRPNHLLHGPALPFGSLFLSLPLLWPQC